MTDTERSAAWRALDALLLRINEIDISDCKTPQQAKSRIYEMAMRLRPETLKKDAG